MEPIEFSNRWSNERYDVATSSYWVPREEANAEITRLNTALKDKDEELKAVHAENKLLFGKQPVNCVLCPRVAALLAKLKLYMPKTIDDYLEKEPEQGA